jgi:UDP-galactopyranose mutase
MSNKQFRFLVVGSGFSGAIIASELVKHLNCTVEIWEERDHMGGNCFTYKDEATDVCVHKYGPHIFNTDKKEIWDYVNQLTELRPYVHRVKANVNGTIFPLPVNLQTINLFFNKNFNPKEATAFVNKLGDASISNPQNFEEQALKFIGNDLYKAFFYGYTKKQWGCEPKELPASILKRIPVRFNYNDNYHLHTYTGIPVNGYTAIFEKLLNHPSIILKLNTHFNKEADNLALFDHIIYTGPIDAFFDYKFGRLGYRTVSFEAFRTDGDYQGCTQVNYCDESIPYTRITEHKHFTPWQSFDKTIYFKEYSTETKEGDTPYYPKSLANDKAMFVQYQQEAEALSGYSFLGRLATYRYMDMQHVIEEALNYSQQLIRYKKGSHPTLSVFPN